jgi:diacylglycerol O-acyltransferase-1
MTLLVNSCSVDFPLIRMGWSKMVATLVVFAFSAVMHEVIISVPFRYIAGHAFIGMLAQAPLILLTKFMDRRYDNAFIGNAVFWCSFCVFGQPMGIILYYFDLWKAAQAGVIAL